jgi:hypothetical protein
MVARCVATAVSSTRPKLGSRPPATASEMWSREAPSTATSTTRPPGTSPRVMAAGGAGGASSGRRAGPRSISGTTRELAIVVTSSTPLGAVPRRPMCASATIRHTPPQIATAIAASVMRRPVSGDRNGAKSVAFSHSTVAPAAAAIVDVQASTRTLSHPGDSTCTAAIWRSTMSA